MSRALLLLALPFVLPAQTKLPPAFQNVFPSPFQRSTATVTQHVKASPVRTMPAVPATAARAGKAQTNDQPCIGPMPSARVQSSSNMPIIQGDIEIDPQMIIRVKGCGPSQAR